MSDQCAVCGHGDLAEINRRLGSSDSVEDIASDYSLTVEDLLKHKLVHIPAEGDLAEKEQIHCYFCDEVLEEEDIGGWHLVGHNDFYPMCNDCAEEAWWYFQMEQAYYEECQREQEDEPQE